MAHFAEIDENNRVKRIIVVANEDCAGGEYPDSDIPGGEFCANLLGGTWKQTSYNNNFRGRYARLGYIFDETLDAFIATQPYESWVLDEATYNWVAPIPYPEDGGEYTWDENEGDWVKVEDGVV